MVLCDVCAYKRVIDNMAVQEMSSSVLDARYASDSETNDETVAAHSMNVQTTRSADRGLEQAGAAEDSEETLYDSDASSSLDDAEYLDQFAGE